MNNHNNVGGFIAHQQYNKNSQSHHGMSHQQQGSNQQDHLRQLGEMGSNRQQNIDGLNGNNYALNNWLNTIKATN